MKNLLFVGILTFVFAFKIADAQVQTGINGQPVKETGYSEIQGDPYLISDWTNGYVTLEGNRKATADLKFDIVSNIILFKGKDGEPLELKDKAKSFALQPANTNVTKLMPVVFVNGLPAVDKQSEDSFYQQIAGGKIGLVKYYKKVIDEQPGSSYTSSTTRRFKLLQTYYIFKNNKLTAIEPGKKAFAALFDDHAKQYDEFLKGNNISFKNDADLQKLFAWYNSL